MNRDDICDLGYESAILFAEECYDSAIIGLSSDGRAIYSYNELLEIIIKTQSCDYTEAIDTLENGLIAGIPRGDYTPIVLEITREDVSIMGGSNG